MKFSRLYALLLLLTTHLLAQESAIVVHPCIGDTLDANERTLYSIFPSVENIRWAVFFLNPDSTLKALVHRNENGLDCDTTFNRIGRSCRRVIRSDIWTAK